MTRESVALLVLGVLCFSLGFGVLVGMRRSFNWDITLREVAGIPGLFLFNGAMLVCLATDTFYMAMAFGLCLFVSQIASAILWFRDGTAHDRIQKMNKK